MTFYLMKKRGLSNIVAKVLIILLVVVAVGIIWFFTRGLVENTKSTTEESQLFSGVQFSMVKNSYVFDSNKNLFFSVQRLAGGGKVSGIYVVLEDSSGQSKIFSNYADLTSTGGIENFETISITILASQHGLGDIARVKIYPVIQNSGEEFILGTTDVINFDSENSENQNQECSSNTDCVSSNSCITATCVNSRCEFNSSNCSPTDLGQTPSPPIRTPGGGSGGGGGGGGGGTTTPPPAGAVCGNSNCESGENFQNCPADCLAPLSVCGNNITESGEECDDNNLISGDGCSLTCEIEHCVLTSAEWNVQTATEGDTLTLIVNATNCDEEILNFTVFENDLIGDDNVSIQPTSAEVINGKAESTWIAEFDAGDPGPSAEYYFVATLSTDEDITISSSNVIVSQLIIPPNCGNGDIDAGEQCDDGNIVTESCVYGLQSCTVCNSQCQNVFGAVSYCGDNSIDSANGEQCDGTDLNGEDCISRGFDSGDLSCFPDCSGFDTVLCISGEIQTCGDNVIEGTEICECGLDLICGNADDELSGVTCNSLEYSGINPTCSSDCLSLDINSCGIIRTISASNRTADFPDSWLVVYNVNNSESVQWVNWYIDQWAIPRENIFGVNASNDERITRDEFENKIFLPLQTYLKNNLESNSRIMGIVVGYRVPGNFYLDSNNPVQQGGGGWSVTNNLADMAAWRAYHRGNPNSFYVGSGIRPRLTKESLNNNLENITYISLATPGKFYLTARIDAPTLEQAKNLTLRARVITEGTLDLTGNKIHYDYSHPGAAGGDEWTALKNAVTIDSITSDNLVYPWEEFFFPSPTLNSAFRFSYYKVNQWQNVVWSNSGARVLHYSLDSFGAVTVRVLNWPSSGVAVPNALYNGGYAAAFGATAEPFSGNEPYPNTILWSFHENQTLGEAFFQANPYVNYMWELDGDPLLRVPNWFN